MADFSVTLKLPTVDNLDRVLGIIVVAEEDCYVDHEGRGVIVPHTHPSLTIQTNIQDHPGWDAEKIKRLVTKLLSGSAEQLEKMTVQGKES